MLFSCHFIHFNSLNPWSNRGKKYMDPLVRVFENLLGAINFQNFWGVCNIGAFNVQRIFLSILGFRVMCAIYGRQIQHPEFRLARSKYVEVTRGARFDCSGNFTGTFLCFLYGDIPVEPICGH